MSTIFVVHREISDQLGTDEVVGVYSTPDRAAAGERQCTTRRAFVVPMELDPAQPLPVKS